MPRPQRCRRICEAPDYAAFAPAGGSAPDTVVLSLDEYEAIRLVDGEKLTHEQCAAQMDVSRSTVTEIYASARGKLADCLVHGKRLEISGGRYRLCNGSAAARCGKPCPKCGGAETDAMQLPKGANNMRIAVTYENGQVFQHFGHTEMFEIYDVEGGKIVQKTLLSTNGSGHGALAGLLGSVKADILICGGIGGGAQMALAEAGVKLYGGVSGKTEDAVAALLAGTLDYAPDVHCNHHAHGDQACGQHGCGHSCHE